MSNCKDNRNKLFNLVSKCKYNLFLSNSDNSKNHDDGATLRDYAYEQILTRGKNSSCKCKYGYTFRKRFTTAFRKIKPQQKNFAKDAIEKILMLAEFNLLTPDSLCIKTASGVNHPLTGAGEAKINSGEKFKQSSMNVVKWLMDNDQTETINDDALYVQSSNETDEWQMDIHKTKSTHSDEESAFIQTANNLEESVVTANELESDMNLENWENDDNVDNEVSFDSISVNGAQNEQQQSEPLQPASTMPSTSTRAAAKLSHQCNICTKYFSSAAALRRHSLIHSAERPYSCEYCPSTFVDHGNFNDHVRRHKGIKSHLCSYCGKTFTNATQLKVHVRVHTNEKPYSCSICLKRFTTNGHCRNHIRTHMSDFAFRCSFCNKGFNKKDNMLNHERRHFDVISLKCKVCARVFRNKQTLKQHMKHHYELKEHKCVYCEKTFSHSYHLSVHRKSCKLRQKD